MKTKLIQRRGLRKIAAKGALLELDLKPDLPLDSSNRTCKPVNFFRSLGWFALRFPATCYRKYLISHLARDEEAEDAIPLGKYDFPRNL